MEAGAASRPANGRRPRGFRSLRRAVAGTRGVDTYDTLAGGGTARPRDAPGRDGLDLEGRVFTPTPCPSRRREGRSFPLTPTLVIPAKAGTQ